MTGFLVRLLISALGLWLASELIPGIEVRGGWTLLGAALLLGIVNAVVRPVLVLLTLPATLVTLGLFLLVINAAMLGLVAWDVRWLHDFRFLGGIFWRLGRGRHRLGGIVIHRPAWEIRGYGASTPLILFSTA